MNYLPRNIENKFKEYLDFFPSVAITGPRQSGKSTFLRHVLPHYEYVTFDDFRNREFFTIDPKRFMRTYSKHVIFDEVQKVPEIFSELKILIDEGRDLKGRFVLTGSSQFSFIKGITESLAGRIGMLSLLPFQFSEIPQNLQKESIFRGGYPELVLENYKMSDEWYSSYLETYLNRDVRDLAHIIDLRDFQRLIRLLGARISQVFTPSEFAKDLGVDTKTVTRWVSVLEASYILFFVPPYFANIGKRTIKSPKFYFYDTGLVSFLTGIKNQEQFVQGPMYGSLFENYVVSEVAKKELHQKTHGELFFLRTSNKEEVDLIIDRRSHREWIEIKATETFRPKMAQQILKFKDPADKAYLVYQGDKLRFGEDVLVLPFEEFISQ
jgi:predicted AAA+ superfamily ATPase